MRASYLVLLFESVHAKLLECDSAFDANVSHNSVPIYQSNRNERLHYFLLIRRNCGVHLLLHLRLINARPTLLFPS